MANADEAIVTLVLTPSTLGHLTVLFEWKDGQSFNCARVHYYVNQEGYEGYFSVWGYNLVKWKRFLNARQACGCALGVLSVDIQEANEQAYGLALNYNNKITTEGATAKQWTVPRWNKDDALAKARDLRGLYFCYLPYYGRTHNCATMAVKVLRDAGIRVQLSTMLRVFPLPTLVGDSIISPKAKTE